MKPTELRYAVVMHAEAVDEILWGLAATRDRGGTRVRLELLGLPFGGEAHLIDLMVKVAREAARTDRTIAMSLTFPLRLEEAVPRTHPPAELVGRDTDPKTSLLTYYGQWVEHAILLLQNMAVGAEDLLYDPYFAPRAGEDAIGMREQSDRLRSALTCYHSGIVSLLRDIEDTANQMQGFASVHPRLQALFRGLNHRLRNIATVTKGGIAGLIERYLEGRSVELAATIHEFLPPVTIADLWTRVCRDLTPRAKANDLRMCAAPEPEWDLGDFDRLPAHLLVPTLYEAMLEAGLNAVGYATAAVVMDHRTLPNGDRVIRIMNDVAGTIDRTALAALGTPGLRLPGMHKRGKSTGMGLSTVGAMLEGLEFPPPVFSVWQDARGRDHFVFEIHIPAGRTRTPAGPQQAGGVIR